MTKKSSFCCDGECNHDACCGKIEENCTHKNGKWTKINLYQSGIPWPILKGAVLRLGGEGGELIKVMRRKKTPEGITLYVIPWKPIVLRKTL